MVEKKIELIGNVIWVMSFDKTSSVDFCAKAWETELHTDQIRQLCVRSKPEKNE